METLEIANDNEKRVKYPEDFEKNFYEMVARECTQERFLFKPGLHAAISYGE